MTTGPHPEQVLKMDVEGAENQIVPELLRAEGAPLVDVLMWECHLKWRGEPGRCQCAILTSP
jgi:hypothetical protein